MSGGTTAARDFRGRAQNAQSHFPTAIMAFYFPPSDLLSSVFSVIRLIAGQDSNYYSNYYCQRLRFISPTPIVQQRHVMSKVNDHSTFTSSSAVETHTEDLAIILF